MSSNLLSVQKQEINYRKSNQLELIDHYQKVELSQAQSRIQEHITLNKKKKNNIESNNILTCLKNHFIFYNLTPSELQNVKEKMFHCKIREGEKLFTYQDHGTCFFIIDKGRMEIKAYDKDKKSILRNNDGFGEIALLYNTERNSQVVALQETELWAIDRVTFRQAVQEIIVRDYTQNKKCFESVRFFSTLNPSQKDIIASSLIKQKFYKGQVIIQQGDPGSTFYYIKEGNASVYKATKFQRKLTKGDSFGEQSLYYNTMRQYTIKADQDVVCLVLGRDTLHKTMGQNIYEVTFKNFIKWAFQKNQIISQFTKQTQENIINEMKISSFKAQESIFKRGVIGFQKIVVVIQGNLKKAKNGTIVATKGQCYGQQFLKDSTKILDDEIIMQNYGVIAEISQQDFNEAVQNQKYNDLVVRKKQESQLSIRKMQSKNVVKLSLQRSDLKQLRVVAQLSAQGQFGPLYILKSQQDEYLLKLISKKLIEQYDVSQFAIDQSRVFQQVSCPFVIQMGAKFQTPNFICYICELVRGEDLYDILKKIGLLSTQDSQFYTASIILILQYFAEKSIICRDVKPQNFMVDNEGYLKLINLPTAKIIEKDGFGNMKKTFTIIGTPHYMAPDIVIGKGYNNLVDLWSLGICLYQFLCGVLPFGDASEDAYEIYEQIMQSELNFPEFFHDKKAKKLIEQLLSQNPSQRHSGSFQNLKRHPWFDDFNWSALLQKRHINLKPPIIPQQKDLSLGKMNLTLAQLMQDKQKEWSESIYDPKWSSFQKLI